MDNKHIYVPKSCHNLINYTSFSSRPEFFIADNTEHLDNEISVADVVLKLWQKRGLVFILPLLFGILGAIVVLTMAAMAGGG